jgi:hypothetical protein
MTDAPRLTGVGALGALMDWASRRSQPESSRGDVRSCGCEIGAAQFSLTTTPRPSPAKPLPVTFNQLTLDFDVEALAVPQT